MKIALRGPLLFAMMACGAIYLSEQETAATFHVVSMRLILEVSAIHGQITQGQTKVQTTLLILSTGNIGFLYIVRSVFSEALFIF